MQTNTLFYVIYSALAMLANLFLPVSTLLGIAMAAALTVCVPILLVGHNQKHFNSIRINWTSSLGCSLVLGVIFTATFTAKMYLLTIVASITGSPYNVPEVNFERLFLLCLVAASTANVCIFFAYDFFKQMKRQRTPDQDIINTDMPAPPARPTPATKSNWPQE